MLKKYIGDRNFYRHVLAVAIPIIIQNTITNFVSLLDNIMVGQVGTLQMSGVAISNQLLFVFNLCIYGAASGAGIFTAQFAGEGDHDGIRQTFRFKFLLSLLLTAGGIFLFWQWGNPLISLFLQGEGSPEEIEQTLVFGREYLNWMLVGLLPFAIAMVYAGTLRETGQTFVPMVAGIVAVFTNLILNYILIFGHFGFPAMGIRGAAIATVVSRYVEAAIVIVWTHTHKEKNPFIQGAYRSMYVPNWLLKRIIQKGMPVMANEFLWSSGTTFLNQCYSVRGLDVVAAMNITSTLRNLVCVVLLSMGNVTAIIMGQLLGSNRSEEEARDTCGKLFAMTVAGCLVFSGLTVAISGAFPQFYNTTPQVRNMAAALICVVAAILPVQGGTHVTYFTLRAGGKGFLTFMFDAGFMWLVSVPLAYFLSRFTGIPIVALYAICLGSELIKLVLGVWMLKSGVWIQNLTKH